jgi:hypothetical protein
MKDAVVASPARSWMAGKHATTGLQAIQILDFLVFAHVRKA